MLVPLIYCGASDIVRPEMFGAKGDGLFDDAPAFNKCLSAGCTIELSKGKTYLLKTAVQPIPFDTFRLDGRGSRIIVDSSYPLGKYDHIFRFADGSKRRRSFVITDIEALYLPGQKFPDKDDIGDSYFIFVDNCESVHIDRVNLESESLYNNLTFFASFGLGRLTMRNCHVKINTLSKQGGCFWLINQYFESSSIEISHCVFEQDTQDETACFSAMELHGVQSSSITGTIKDCVFRSPCKSPSSGFLMAYNHYPAKANIHLEFRRCCFLATGENSRKIMSYQIGDDPAYPYATMSTLFINCDMQFVFAKEYETGLLCLPFLSQAPSENYLFSFKRCRFTMKNIHPLIGDKDGDKEGCYAFRNCSYVADKEPFVKRFNIHTSELYLIVNGKKTKYGITQDKMISEVYENSAGK